MAVYCSAVTAMTRGTLHNLSEHCPHEYYARRRLWARAGACAPRHRRRQWAARQQLRRRWSLTEGRGEKR
eukprot:246603-Pyramimonas_sp.AAC.2